MIKKILKNSQKRLEPYIKKHEGSLISSVYISLLTILRPLYFPKEFLFAKGLKRKSKSLQQSILFFTVHKSASTFIRHTLIKLIDDKDFEKVSFGHFLSDKKIKEYYYSPAKMSKMLLDKGFFYGPFHSYYPFPNLDKFKIVLVLRDPRDVLTSHYFSTLYNHPLSRKEVIAERKAFANLTIDEYVLQTAPALAKKYAEYWEYFLNKPNVLLLKYEDMISNFGPWLHKLVNFLELKGKEQIIDELVASTSFVVKKEDKNSFVRNIKAGDHLNKLKPETISELNKLFQSSIIKFGYTL